MGTDVSIMPLWQYKAGAFETPAQKMLGEKVQTIQWQSANTHKQNWLEALLCKCGFAKPKGVSYRQAVVVELSKGQLAKAEKAARKEVEKLKREISKLTGIAIDWTDEGEEVYCEQFRGANYMRTFACWQDHRQEIPDFVQEDSKGHYHGHPAWAAPEPVARQFPVLATHEMYNGYMLPIDFSGVHKVEPYVMFGRFDAECDAASSYAALRECKELKLRLGDHLKDQPELIESEPYNHVRWFTDQLIEMCELSIKHNLPIIFDS